MSTDDSEPFGSCDVLMFSIIEKVLFIKIYCTALPVRRCCSVCSLPHIPRIAMGSYVVRCYARLRLISLNAFRASLRSMRSDIATTLLSVVALARLDFCPFVLP